ncbi:hypothetical protein BHS09_22225 [Myxococcus xanthus]|uniref:Uncharacterized protein n=1 Tax=Myxococcus xanthus TaxID=34 RepID=A0AAE6G212_MYXXA|nr:hypothetical protein BHS09_22225 [Myxococcus xanthus]QDE76753.1 hypothetical protein BHS08_22240 [Myxococcus xanthus]
MACFRPFVKFVSTYQMDSPPSLMRLALWTRRSRMASASVADDGVPVFRLELGRHHGARELVAVLQDFEQLLALRSAKRLKAEVIEDEHLGLGQALEHVRVGSIGARLGELIEET